jgi:hemerythrin
MPLMTWKDEYSVNNEELDSHHKQLISILNSLYGDCLDSDNENCVGPKLDDLLAYAEYHFKAEVEYMRRIEYFEVDDHIERHNAFIYRLGEMKRIPRQNQLEQAKELIVFIGKWLLHHVLDEDRKYAVYAAGRTAWTDAEKNSDRAK